jgi:pimeloyl-ACP methyl ester carboxylesterase
MMQNRPQIETKRYPSEDGEVSYLRARNCQCPYDLLFVHGLGADNAWFPDQFETYSLGEHSWIVPDLLGFGQSDKPKRQQAYGMENQAEKLMSLVVEEDVKVLGILAHSMGGPIAVSLIENLARETDVEILGLFYLEGNLDINDAYLSGKIAASEFEEYIPIFYRRLEKIEHENPDLYETTRAIGPFPFWASSVDLVNASRNDELLPRIQKHRNLPLHFVFGAQNRGRFTSEALVKKAALPLSYVPNAGHMMYLDNPEGFWHVIRRHLNRQLDIE